MVSAARNFPKLVAVRSFFKARRGSNEDDDVSDDASSSANSTISSQGSMINGSVASIRQVRLFPAPPRHSSRAGGQKKMRGEPSYQTTLEPQPKESPSPLAPYSVALVKSVSATDAVGYSNTNKEVQHQTVPKIIAPHSELDCSSIISVSSSDKKQSEGMESSAFKSRNNARVMPVYAAPLSAVDELVTGYEMMSHIFSREFGQLFKAAAPYLTTHFLVDPPRLQAPHGEMRLPNDPRSLPPLLRTMYLRYFRRFPLFAGRGEEYLRELDAFVETGFRGLLVTWMRATRFDILGFFKHHLAIFYFAYPSEQSIAHTNLSVDCAQQESDDSDSDNDEFFDAVEDHDTHKLRKMRSKKSSLFISEKIQEQETLRVFKSTVLRKLAASYTAQGTGRFTLPVQPAPCINAPLHFTQKRPYPQETDVEADHKSKLFIEKTVSPSQEEIKLQSIRYRELAESWVYALRAGYTILQDVQPCATNPDDSTSAGAATPVFGDSLFESCAKAETVEQLPPKMFDFMKKIMKAIAVTLDNVFDEPQWRDKMRGIWSKLPLGLIVGSLRLINPIPFVERVLRLFVWRPRGLKSLLQQLCAVLCSSDRTTQLIKDMRPKLRMGDRTKIELAVEPLIRDLMTPDPILGYSTAIGSHISDDEIAEILYSASVDGMLVPDGMSLHEEDDNQRHQHYHRHNHHRQGHHGHSKKRHHQYRHDRANIGGAHVLHVEYARLLIRRAEKTAFVEMIGSPSFTAFIVHFAEVMPPLLTEMWACIDMANLVDTFFKTVSGILDALKIYDDKDALSPAAKREKVMEKLEHHIWHLFHLAYPFVHVLSKREPMGPTGLHAVIDWFAREFGERGRAGPLRGELRPVLELSFKDAVDAAIQKRGGHPFLSRNVLTNVKRGLTEDGAGVLGPDQWLDAESRCLFPTMSGCRECLRQYHFTAAANQTEAGVESTANTDDNALAGLVSHDVLDLLLEELLLQNGVIEDVTFKAKIVSDFAILRGGSSLDIPRGASGDRKSPSSSSLLGNFALWSFGEN